MSSNVDENGRPDAATEMPSAASTPSVPRSRRRALAEPAPSRTASGLTQAGEFEAIQAMPMVVRIVGAVIAPTTLLTALMFYFGLLYAVAYYRYFGVNYTVLDLSVQDFLILSADAAVPPLSYLAGATLVVIGILRLPIHRLSRRRRLVVARWVAPMLATAGLVLVGLAVANAYFRVPVFPASFLEARGLSLAIGVLVIAYAGHLRRTADPARRRRTRPTAPEALIVAKWASLFVLVAVGLFWAVGSYAVGAGTGNAQGFTAGLSCAPEVVVYSEKNLDMEAAGVPAAASVLPDAAYAFRYPGFRLVPQAGDQYLLLPADWARGGRPAVLLPRADTLRLEFLPGAC